MVKKLTDYNRVSDQTLLAAEKAREDLASTLADKGEELKTMSQAKQDLADQVLKQTSDVTDKAEKLKVLESKLETAQVSLASEAEKVTKLKEELSTSERLASGRSKEIEELRAQATSSESGLQQDLAKKMEELSAVQGKLEQMTDSYDELKLNYNSVKEGSSIAEKELRDLKSDKESLLGEIGVLKVKTDAEVKRLSGSISTKDVELETLRSGH